MKKIAITIGSCVLVYGCKPSPSNLSFNREERGRILSVTQAIENPVQYFYGAETRNNLRILRNQNHYLIYEENFDFESGRYPVLGAKRIAVSDLRQSIGFYETNALEKAIAEFKKNPSIDVLKGENR